MFYIALKNLYGKIFKFEAILYVGCHFFLKLQQMLYLSFQTYVVKYMACKKNEL
jgi:hypothetical protein